MTETTEKKVEYIELIYDLIFVYIIGRNNSLIEHVSPGGFVEIETYIGYLMATLVVLTVWYHSTLLINRYGKNDTGQHICLFVNMYLLYFMADSTSVHWQHFYVRYNLAWTLILLNLSIHYFVCLHKITREGKQNEEQEKQSGKPGAAEQVRTAEEEQIRHSIVSLLIQALIAAAGIPGYFLTGLPLSLLAIPAGFLMDVVGRGHSSRVPVDFMHLTERVMLYIVFTFGEMVIAISGYFVGEFKPSAIWYSLCAFLIVAGLFVSYGFVYNRILDRETRAHETGYLILHIFMIIALNNLSTALQFMREASVADIPKNVFLTVSFLMYYLALFLMWIYARNRQKADVIFLVRLCIGSTVFAALMAHFYRNGMISIGVSVLYIYAMFALIHLFWRKRIREEEGGK